MSDFARPRSLATLLQGLIDYAGLFPPAGLAMAEAVRRFAAYRSSPDAWALGRFVVNASRLDEFAGAADERAAGLPVGRDRGAALPVGQQAPQVWPLTVLAALPLEGDLQRVNAFHAAHGPSAGRWQARVDSLEVKVTSAEEIRRASQEVPEDVEVFFEVPASEAAGDLYEAAAAAGRGLKIRTGGTSIDAFPPSGVVARFLASCAAAKVPFKATAGLHHPFRSSHPVTYEPGAPTAVMHGFVNLFVAAALLVAGRVDVAGATRVLEDELPQGFTFSDEWLAWREHRLDVAQLAAARALARSFGSCAFEEPIGELPDTSR